LQEALNEILGDKELQAVLKQLSDNQLSDEKKEAVRERFIVHPSRQRLQRYVAELLGESDQKVASWFVTDANGIQLASAFLAPVASSAIGGEFSFRTYFHGGKVDLVKGIHHDLPPLEDTRLSSVLRSTSAGTWKIAVSTPIVVDTATVGVVALTLELGRLGNAREFATSDDRFVVLVDGREGSARGVILQHPLFNEILAQENELPDYINRVRVPLDQLPRADQPQEDTPRKPSEAERILLYRDPIADLAEGKAFDRNWIAARQEVFLESSRSTGKAIDTGLVVLVQEDYDSAVEPLRTLRENVLRDGMLAFLLIVSIVILLWYFVTRTLRDPNEALRRAGGSPPTPSSLYSMDTLELPKQFRDLPHHR